MPGDVEEPGPVFTAQYPGQCVYCGGAIVPGDRIARAAVGGYTHIGECR
jgi:hypothetical protein